MINEAIFALQDGVAPAAIDEVMKLGMSHPMGPPSLADLIGLDVCRHPGDAAPRFRGRQIPSSADAPAHGRRREARPKVGSGFF